LAGDGLMPKDAIRETGIFKVVPTNIVKRLGPIGGPHAVDLNDDEAELRECRVARERTKRFGHERSMRPGVDAFNHGVFLGWIELGRAANDAPDVSLAVASLGNEHFWRLPACRFRFRDVRVFQGANGLTI